MNEVILFGMYIIFGTLLQAVGVSLWDAPLSWLAIVCAVIAIELFAVYADRQKRG